MHKTIISAFLGLILSAPLCAMSLHDALELENLDELKRMIETDPTIDVNTRNAKKETVLLLASTYGNLNLSDIVTFLLDHGANPDLQDEYGNTASIWAAHYGNTKSLLKLVEYGANLKLINFNGQNPTMALWENKGTSVKTMDTLITTELMHDAYNDGDMIIDDDTFTEEQKAHFHQAMVNSCSVSYLKAMYHYAKTRGSKLKKANHKQLACTSIANKPGILIKYIENDWYDETIIKEHYFHHVTNTQFIEKPMVCVKVLSALRKQRMITKLIANDFHTNVHFTHT